MSLTVPIPSWRGVIARPIRTVSSRDAPAIAAIAPLTSPSRTDGNGWARRIQPSDRVATVRGGSDVDELAEVRDEVLDEALAAIGDLRADARDEREQGDRRHDQAALAITTHNRGWASA
jgi:hypothetical protein